MKTSGGRRPVVNSALVAVLLLTLPRAPLAAATPAVVPTRNTLLAKLNQPTATLADKEAAVGAILDLPDGPPHLAAQLNRSIIRDLELYRLRLAHTAAQAYRGHLKSDAAAEIAELRAKVLSVSRGEGITKERIHEIADPAVARLKELLLLAPAALFEKLPALQTQQDELLADARWRQQALDKTPAKQRAALEGVVDTTDLASRLDGMVQAAAFEAMPIPNADRLVLAENVKRGAALDPGEARGIAVLNQIRVLVGVKALLIDARLCQAARGHSTEMKDEGYFSHESPTPALKTPWDRARLAGTSAGGECIAAGAGTGDGAIAMWWNSPGHHAIIMSASNRIGLGRKDTTWTLMTGG